MEKNFKEGEEIGGAVGQLGWTGTAGSSRRDSTDVHQVDTRRVGLNEGTQK